MEKDKHTFEAHAKPLRVQRCLAGGLSLSKKKKTQKTTALKKMRVGESDQDPFKISSRRSEPVRDLLKTGKDGYYT